MKQLKILAVLLVALGALLVVWGVLVAAQKDKTTTIFIIGDSTAANKDISGGKQERGWGMALQCFFDDHIVVDNHAVNGRSSLSFINEGRWDKVLSKMKPGDYVIIQFGHNDEKPKADRHTDPGSTFDYNLAKFVRETREHGGIPVLMNCVVRRNFFVNAPENDDDEKLRTTTFKDGVKMVEGDTLIDTHGLYAVAPRDVARRMHVHFVDANRITHDLEQGLGCEASKKLHMWFKPGEEPSVPDGRQDNTHYNVYGAHQVARLLADALCEEVPVLRKCRLDADITVDHQGRGDELDLQKAVDKALLSAKAETTIRLLGGQWTKPQLPKKHRIKFILSEGATWKE
ncbi:MAG: rhamnogalacturonan acetylesterase [Prevotella sp.]|jgi:pectinesterase